MRDEAGEEMKTNITAQNSGRAITRSVTKRVCLAMLFYGMVAMNQLERYRKLVRTFLQRAARDNYSHYIAEQRWLVGKTWLASLTTLSFFTGICLAQTQNNTVVAWGASNNVYGVYVGESTPPTNLTNVIAVAAGGSQSFALNANGVLVGWGDNSQGQTNIPDNLSNVIGVAVGFFHCVALKADGSVVAWGSNVSGETSVPAGLSNVVAVAANGCDCLPNGNKSLALTSDGTVVGWGATSVPTNLTRVRAISAGGNHALALRRDGTITGWGLNANGQATSPVGLSNVVAISAGGYHSMALRLDGTVITWGNNYYGQTNVPSGLSNLVAIAAGEDFSVALRNDGTVIAWGSNIAGESVVPVGLSNIVAITTGERHVLALQNSGIPVIARQPIGDTVYSGSTVILNAAAVGPSPMTLQWQLNGTNLVGATNSTLILTNVQPDATGLYTMAASNPITGGTISSNAALSVLTSPPIILNQPSNTLALSGGNAIFAISVTGSLPISYQWQFNGTNILNATNATLSLTNLTWAGNGVYTVVASNAYGPVISSNAVLTLPQSFIVAWGNNSWGQTNVPSGLTNATAIAAAYQNSLALKTDGTVSGWGYNSSQQTIPPSGLSNVVALAAGGGGANPFSLALKSDGTVTGWGNNSAQQSSSPSALTNVLAITAGQIHSVALRKDGSVFAWGNNSYGQTNVPATLTNAVAVSAGMNSCLALRNNGVVSAWGDNSNGQTNVPTGLTNVAAIASGWYHCLALRSDGTVAAWGYNNSGQTNVPPGLSNVVAIAAGQTHSLAIKTDGTVVAWGQSTYTNVPSGFNHAVAVAAGADHSLALLEDGPPVIFTQPSSQTNYAGFTAFLTGNSIGARPMYFQWMFNGTNIAGATNTTLVLPNLQPNMSGVYSFISSNGSGSALSSNAVIAVLTNSPLLTLQPSNKTVIAGSNVTFSVGVGAGPIPNSYQWLFSGTNITGATNAVLTLTNVQPLNQGYYSAVVTNNFGTSASSNAYLTVIVLDLPTALNATGLTWTTSGSSSWFAQTNTSHDGIQAAQSGGVANGQSSTLQTTVTGPGTLTFWWMFGPLTSPFPNTLSFSSSQGNNSASVNSTSGWQQRAFYLGVGQQTLTWNYSRSANFSSQSTGWLDEVTFTPGATSPGITSISSNAYVRAGANVFFSVNAYGTPPLAYQWQLNGTNLPGKTSAFLNLTSVQLTNAGVYSVVVTNGFGTVTTNTTLWVGQFGFNADPGNLLMSTNGFKLQLDGILTTNPVVIFGSTDLVNWLPVFTNSATTGSVQFLDFTATNTPARFYRARE
jgi:alpha-tubulin suppressor-like RCC1 family protein